MAPQVRKHTYIYIVLFTATALLSGQQLSIYNQYRLNEFLINPATAGYDGYTSINITSREQWIGLKNSPHSNSVSVQTRILKKNFQIKTRAISRNVLRKSRNGRVGIGGFLFNDKNGLVQRTGSQLSYAYHLNLLNSQLSFGLSAFLYQFSIDDEQLRFRQIDMDNSDFDPARYSARENTYIPDIGIGVNYATKRLMLGFSATQLLASRLTINSDLQGISERYFYLIGRYRYSMNADWETEPHVVIRSPQQVLLLSDKSLSSRVLFDASNTFIYKKDYWFGLGARTLNKSVFGLMGIRYDRFYFGYSFDYSFARLARRSFGSHEFMFALKLGDNVRRYRWLERY